MAHLNSIGLKESVKVSNIDFVGYQKQFPQDFKSISSNRNAVCLFMSREANDDENDIY